MAPTSPPPELVNGEWIVKNISSNFSCEMKKCSKKHSAGRCGCPVIHFKKTQGGGWKCIDFKKAPEPAIGSVSRVRIEPYCKPDTFSINVEIDCPCCDGRGEKFEDNDYKGFTIDEALARAKELLTEGYILPYGKLEEY